MAKIVVLGAGISGLASAALLANAGHEVVVLERNGWIGGKSRRIELAGQRMDTGPALVTFPEVWQQFLELYDSVGEKKHQDLIDLRFTKLNEVGRYFYRNNVTDLPVKKGHHWHKPWQRFANKHSKLTPAISKLLTASPLDPKALPALLQMLKVYGTKLTTKNYIDSLNWMPKGLKEVIAIHTLNAGVSPKNTLALYASMTAAMATEGISVPIGGVNEIPLAIAKLAEAAGAEIHLNEAIVSVSKKEVSTDIANYPADFVVSALDPKVLSALMGKPRNQDTQRSCSGVAIYAVLKEPLPADTVTHSVVMPDEPEKLYEALEGFVPPAQTMAFVNYYKASEIYPNTKATVAVLLTAPADGNSYDINSDWVSKEIIRISKKLGLKKPITELFEEHIVLDPAYFGDWGSYKGALYGATRRMWQSGPFHTPAHHNIFRPWLYRVGASVHPGGGIPAVLGGSLISMRKLLAKTKKN
jgi:phytoene desaturase